MSEFRTREYELLKSEVQSYVAESRSLETYAVGGAVAVYAWLATHHDDLPSRVIWLVPLIFPILGAVRAWALGAHIEVIGSYLGKLECELQGTPGWEAFLAGKRGPLAASTYLFWLLFLVASLAVSFSFFCSTPAA
jgi:hypothetical protein